MGMIKVADDDRNLVSLLDEIEVVVVSVEETLEAIPSTVPRVLHQPQESLGRSLFSNVRSDN